MKTKFLLCGLLGSMLFSCNEDNDIVFYNPQPPKIELDSETAVYKTKVGKEFRVIPAYSNAEGATYSWKLDGAVISEEPSLTCVFNEANEAGYFITLEVVTQTGSDTDEIKVIVSNLAPPVISLVLPPTGLDVAAGKTYRLSPDVQNAEGASFLWKVNGQEVGTEKEYDFCERELGTYTVSLYAENKDGNATKTFKVNVVDKVALQVVFAAPMFGLYDEEVVKYVPLGRAIYLRPYLFNGYAPSFQWSLDGVDIPNATGELYAFQPEAKGEYLLTLTVTDTEDTNEAQRSITRNITRAVTSTTSIDIKVVCCDAEGSSYRSATADSSPTSAEVLEFVAAPGQFVNDGYHVETLAQANAYAQQCLDGLGFVSLGGFGGYIIAGFDHSIDNIEGQYNFSVRGNQFQGSSEPGIVWVSQDTNGNGLPDDEWFELKGCEYGLAGTKQWYAVTYYRPEGLGMDVAWTDNYGTSGCVDYLLDFHQQGSYYPDWVAADSFTLFGSCLEARNYQDNDLAGENGSSEFWVNPPYEWGYADNSGSDQIGNTPQVGFKISNAVHADGSPANLRYVDFVKVVNGLNTKSGWLGELSTEVLGFKDENIDTTSR